MYLSRLSSLSRLFCLAACLLPVLLHAQAPTPLSVLGHTPGDDFYLAGTTMHAMPGLVVLHSKDLVNWKFLSYATDRLDFGPEYRLEGGREIYGRMPVTTVGTADEVGSGRLLPSTGVTQLAATLGGWMGLSAAELAWVLPNLGAFPTANLGFA